MQRRSGESERLRRVLFVTTGLGLGGAEALLLALARHCRTAAWEPTVVTLVPGGHYQQHFRELAIPLIELGVRRYAPNIGPLRRLCKIIQETDPDIVQTWMYHANAFVALTLRMSSVLPETRMFWGIFNSQLRLESYPATTRAVFRLQARWSMRPAGIIYNSERACREHTTAGFAARRNVIISNGIDLDKFRPDSSARVRVRKELGIGEDVPVAVVVARHDPMKDWPTALAAIARVPGLVTLACGAQTENLPPQERLIRLGPRTDMPSIYAASDIFFLPSAYGEGMSVAMCEAAASGVPLVVTDVGDNATLARQAGEIVPVGDSPAMAQALARLAADARRRGRLGKIARGLALERFDEDAVFRPVIAAYRAQL